jgi:hypothetical protein
MFGSLVEKAFLVLFLFLFALNIWVQHYYWSIVAILIPIFITFVFPLIKFLYAKAYYKMDFIEYFFDSSSFGYTIGEYKLEIKKEKIEYIKANNNYFLVKVFKQKFYFVSDKEQIQKTKNKLLNSEYKTLFSKSQN